MLVAASLSGVLPDNLTRVVRRVFTIAVICLAAAHLNHSEEVKAQPFACLTNPYCSTDDFIPGLRLSSRNGYAFRCWFCDEPCGSYPSICIQTYE